MQSTGDILIKDLQLFVGAHTTSVVRNFDVGGSLTVADSITCVSLTQTSDRNVKDDIQDLIATDAQAVVDAVNAKTFIRTDLKEDAQRVPRRVGFVAQDLEAALPSHWTNLTNQGKDGIRSVAYDRLVCLLWTVVQSQKTQIDAMGVRLTALENNS